MFFDEPKTDQIGRQLLKEIAKKQKQLFSCHFEWGNTPVFVCMKKESTEDVYQRLLKELNGLKLQLKQHCKNMGYYQGNAWWNLPWEQVEESLFQELQEEKEAGKWRYAHQWNAVLEKDMYVLFLREEGHYSDFSSRSATWIKKESEYDTYEQMDMIEDRKKEIRTYELKDIFWNNDDPVRSVKTGEIYESRRAYYESSEYKMDKDFYLMCYERSLYTLHKTSSVQAVSNSCHFDCIRVVAQYHIRENGTLDYMHLFGFEVCDQCGKVPCSVTRKYQNKDSAIFCAAYLAEDAGVKHVPMQLFGKNIMEEAVDYYEAIRQAKLYTCLADKLEVST